MQPVTNIHSVLNQAIHHHQAGYLAEAEKIYREILAHDPANADALHLLGVLAHQTGHHLPALELIEKALSANNDVALYHNSRGAVLRALGRHEEAETAYERAITLDPHYGEALKNLGALFKSQGRRDQAAAMYERLLALQPDFAEGHFTLGDKLAAEGALEEALARYERGLALAPNNAAAYYNWSMMHFQKSPVREWKNLCETFLARPVPLKLHEHELYVRLAIYHWVSGDYEKAAATLKTSGALAHHLVNCREKNVVTTRAYETFLNELLRFHATAPQPPAQPSSREIALIGNSHCLSYAHKVLDVHGTPHKVIPHLVVGCKAWHLAREGTNIYKRHFEAILDSLAPKTQCFITLGEIDCRFDEGIISHYKKHGGNVQTIVSRFVPDFVKNVVEAMQQRHLEVAFLNVPAPYCQALRQNYAHFREEDEELSVLAVRLFNAALQEAAAGFGLPVIDVYAISAGTDGRSNGKHHIDDRHLNPDALALAFAAIP